jgi:hypothetical protein
MPAKIEDLVQAINDAPNEFALSRLPFDTMKQGLSDLVARLQALETKDKDNSGKDA